MKKISLLFVMLLAFTVSVVAQSLPKPATPELSEFIDYGKDGNPNSGINLGYSLAQDFDGNLVADDYTLDKYFNGEDYTILDPAKVSFLILTDNGKIFTFTPELFPDAPIQVTEPMTQFPYSGILPNGSIGYWDIHFTTLTNNVEEGEEPFFTWRIGIQTCYTDNGETSFSDPYYMEVYPQLKEAAQVTSTSFLADWSCDAENTYILGGFRCYDLYVINMETQETTVIEDVKPTNSSADEWGNEFYLPGATYMVEGLTPGTTYQYYVVCSDYHNSFTSAVREVTLLPDVYIMGEVNEQSWAPNAGTLMEYDAEKNVYTATVTFDGRGENGENYFSFTTKLAENSEDWDGIAPYRFGAVSEGDFWVTDEMLGVELSMETGGDAYRIPAGEYYLTLDYTRMKLIIEKVVSAHDYELGDVNHDHAVNIADVTTLIDNLLGTGTVCEICADVNGDGPINIADVTALIDKLLGGSN